MSWASRAGLSWPLPGGLLDQALETVLFRRPERGGERVGLVPQWSQVHVERRRKGVTLELLWQECRPSHPAGYSYSRFCELYREWAK